MDEIELSPGRPKVSASSKRAFSPSSGLIKHTTRFSNLARISGADLGLRCTAIFREAVTEAHYVNHQRGVRVRPHLHRLRGPAPAAI